MTLHYLPHAIMGAGIWLATHTQPFPALTIGDIICFAILAWLLLPRRGRDTTAKQRPYERHLLILGHAARRLWRFRST